MHEQKSKYAQEKNNYTNILSGKLEMLLPVMENKVLLVIPRTCGLK